MKSRFASKASSTLQYRAVHKQTDQTLSIEDKIVPQVDETGRITALIGILRDITQHKAMQGQTVPHRLS